MTLAQWTARPRPGGVVLQGETVRLEPLDWDHHGEGLTRAVAGSDNADIWRYMPDGPFEDLAQFRAGFGATAERLGWAPFILRRPADQRIVGMSSYMRIREAHGSAEVGAVAFSKALKRTRMATEAMYLMADHIFDERRYRRYEWKCNTENEASKAAALRLGFRFEGVFRNDMVVKGKNRDTAWYAMTDEDWPAIKAAFQAWLMPDNFNADGTQRRSLRDFRE